MKIAELVVRSLNVFKNWLIKKFWPWFIKEVWPLIEKYIIEMIVAIISESFDKIIKWWKNRKKRQVNTIFEKIDEAEKKATESSDQNEKEKQNAIAQIWREVAEMLREENDELLIQLNKIKAENLSKVENSLHSIELGLKDSKDGLLFSTNKLQHKLTLPHLELGEGNENCLLESK